MDAVITGTRFRLRWRGEVEHDHRYRLCLGDSAGEVIHYGRDGLILADASAPVEVVRNAQGQPGSRGVAGAPAVRCDSGGNVHRHLANGVGRHVEGIDGIAVAAGKAAGHAVDHADGVKGETGDRLAEGGGHGGRRVEPHLGVGAGGNGDAGSRLLGRNPGRDAAVLRLGRCDGRDGRKQDKSQKQEGCLQSLCHSSSRCIKRHDLSVGPFRRIRRPLKWAFLTGIVCWPE